VAGWTGQLLVATPELADPNFSRTVVLLVDGDEDGVLGVVLNRPTETGVAELAPALVRVAAAPEVVFAGGPVSPDVTVCLAAAQAEGLCSWTVLDPAAPPDLQGPVRLYQGYAGWGSGQLAAELAAGAWWLVQPLPADLVDPRPERLWRTVLRRQAPPRSWVSTLPEDPTAN
jgi:putative transcriptional regulator